MLSSGGCRAAGALAAMSSTIGVSGQSVSTVEAYSFVHIHKLVYGWRAALIESLVSS
jgi:hypothetical protein